ncbi:MAG: 30S ribosomal protein S13 [Candidatus Omnitrophica bacterium]|nr:30S ribosomal protein S13 [Candidatus Omnitrophota bacterium]
MPRILGVDIPAAKRTEVALTYVYGIGQSLSKKILSEAKVNPEKRAKDLSDKEIHDITSVIQKKGIRTEGDVRREIQQNIRRLIDIRSYRGQRHVRGLPVRGQRTHTNSRTRKGPRKTVGGLLKKPPAPK